jgi:uncharacterized protein (TIGR03000 family)
MYENGVDTYYPNPGTTVPANPTEATPAESTGGSNQSTEISPNSEIAETILTVSLPEESKLFVKGRPTTSTGANREFVARRLVRGKIYTFDVKAVLDVDGQLEERTQVVSIVGGQDSSVAFDFSVPETVITSVEVELPEDAKLTLAGMPTHRTGEQRVFQTSTLEKGNTWNDYRVVATIERDGKTVEQVKTLNVTGGGIHKVVFDFQGDDTRIASR